MPDQILPGEMPPIDWPQISFGPHRLVVRWTFYAQWLLSRRKVDIKDLRARMAAFDPSIVDITVECFAAAVAENYTDRSQTPPDANYWASEISRIGGNPLFLECSQKIWDAAGKAQAAATPAPRDVAVIPEQAAPLN